MLPVSTDSSQANAPRTNQDRAAAQERLSTQEALIARAKSLELNTPYVPPPGDPLEHHTAGFAEVLCSAVFITGLDPEFAAENVGYFASPYAERAKVGKPVDRVAGMDGSLLILHFRMLLRQGLLILLHLRHLLRKRHLLILLLR